jgi:ABC-type nitrate/sulfonate/bicarbonate transport system permease component
MSSATARAGRRSGGRQGPLSAVLGSRWLYRLLTLVIFAVAWQLYAELRGGLLTPSFTGTVGAVIEQVADAEVYRAFLISNQALAIGFVIAVVLGLPIGLATARFAIVDRLADPYINLLLVTPMAALIPILFMSLGLGLASRVVLVVVFAIPMVIVNGRAGVRQVDPGLIEMARSFGAEERTIWRRILLPGALPAILTGIRLALGRAITGMVIVELLMVSVGIGSLILKFRGLFESESLYAVVILVVVEALVLVSLVRWLERRIAPWAQVARLGE